MSQPESSSNSGSGGSSEVNTKDGETENSKQEEETKVGQADDQPCATDETASSVGVVIRSNLNKTSTAAGNDEVLTGKPPTPAASAGGGSSEKSAISAELKKKTVFGKKSDKNRVLSEADRQMSPMQIAFSRGHDDIVKLLLSKGALS